MGWKPMPHEIQENNGAGEGTMERNDEKLSRRNFLKVTGAAAAVAGGAGAGTFGYQAGKDPASYTGCVIKEGGFQTFNRERYAVKGPAYEKVGESRRIDARTEVIFSRTGRVGRQLMREGWTPERGVEGLKDDLLKVYYGEHPEDMEEDARLFTEIRPKRREEPRENFERFLLSEAWSSAMGAVSPPPIATPPEESDFPRKGRSGEPVEPLKMKSPEKTSKLIKAVAHQLGSVLVGVAKLNPDWVYRHPMRGRGMDPDEPFDVPEHWVNAVVVGVPMSWDAMYANPNFGSSNEAYSQSRIIAYRLTAFIKKLGYAARPHIPGTSYDLMVPPIMVDAGLGEQGRHSVVITPELGPNFRPAVVTTNIPLKADRPIEFGAGEFCKTCKICAEQCPSGAITMGGKEVVRGYRRYQMHASKCYNFWNSNLGNMGCRICIACCPFSRKSNWLHRTALHVTGSDPTGLSHSLLTEMQKKLYPSPNPQDYYMESMGGRNASYREPPWWMRTEDFIEK